MAASNNSQSDHAKPRHSSILIVGAGIFGASTVYHLSLTHPDVSSITILDRSPFPSPKAASSDINKIVRADYGSPFYMALAYEAMDAWATWPLLKEFYHQTGWVMVDEKGSDIAERIRSNFQRSGRPDESRDLSFKQMKDSWNGVFSGMDTSDYDKSYFNPSAGWADASLAVAAMLNEATAKGIRYEVGEAMDLVTTEGANGIQCIETTDGRKYTADKILLSVGAWTPWLMASLEARLSISGDASIDKQIFSAGVCTTAFKVSSEEANYYGNMPVLIYGAKGEVMPPNRDGMFKFTNANTFKNTQKHPSGREVSVPQWEQGDVSSKLRKQSLEIVRQRIPQILDNERQQDEWRLCWDAVSQDQNQLITQHPDPRLQNLYLATAGSFHSWKFLPIIGKYVINVLNGESNGAERDRAWQWKSEWSVRGAHEKVLPKAELKDFD